MIVPAKGGFKVMSEMGKNLWGPYKSKGAARKRLEQVEFFKRRRKGGISKNRDMMSKMTGMGMALALAILTAPSRSFAAGALAAEFNGPYLDSIFSHPASVPYSAGVTFNSRFESASAVTMAGIVWHKADVHNTLMPQKLIDLGFQPIGWAFNLGFGKSGSDYVVPMGVSANLMPMALGPVLKLMGESGNKALQGISSLISSRNGGVAFGPEWTAYPMVNGTILPVNRWRFPPGWFVGATFSFE